MKVVHELEFDCRCPQNDGLDSYVLRVETDRLIKVEDVLAAVEALPERAFQEEITCSLARNLRCVITTIGTHSGVRTTCTAGC